MTEPEPKPEVGRAVALMAEALELLGSVSEHDTATAHLQLAHDLVKGVKPGLIDDALADAGPDELRMDPAAVRALGGTLTVLASVLGRAGVIPMRELADILAIYATITSESDRPQGLLIGCWASILREAADHCTKDEKDTDAVSSPGA